MDKDNYEKIVLPLLRGGEGYEEEYSPAYEFKQNLDLDDLVEEKLLFGWVFWRKCHGSHPILNLLKKMAGDLDLFGGRYLIQFWGWELEVEGGHRYLSTRNHPFLVTNLGKGVSWYRNVCKDHVYDVDVEAEQLGGVGRAYRNKQPESTPDLRLYSDHEFPLRFQAAYCGFRGYLALPLFDFHSSQNQCFGVLEFLSPDTILEMLDPICGFYENLKLAGFRSTHSHSSYTRYQLELQVDCEIKKTLELAVKAIPRLLLAQVWVPCRQCHTSQCMETAYLANQEHVAEYDYVLACDLHTLQRDANCNTLFWDDTISKYPLAHYAQKAGFSLGFAIDMRSHTNQSYVIQFFLQPKYKEDSFMQVLRIIEMKFKSFKFVWGGKFVEQSIVESRIELESIDLTMDSYEEIFSDSDFTKYIETDDLCCSHPYSDGDKLWVFRSPTEQVFHERVLMEKKMQHFMEGTFKFGCSYMMQFWAPIMVNNSRYLTTRVQPYALSCLAKGLASFRKACIKHLYLVDEEAKEVEMGPVGRVFKNGHPEPLYDLCSYSPQEFYMRTYALHCGIRIYLALPVFDDKQECAGVIEFIGYDKTYFDLPDIMRTLEANKLWPPYFYSYPTSMKAEIEGCNIEAKAEIKNVLDMIEKIPQCLRANVWVPFEKCRTSSLGCMKWLNPIDGGFLGLIDLIHVEPKIGMIGMILESETKAGFCQDVSEFGITDCSLRCKTCFAICLQSSHTGNLLYVLECYLYQSCKTYDYLKSFLKFLLPVLKNELKSFKIASGNRVGEGELVVEVIEFSEASQLTFPESDRLDEFQIKFKSVVYGQKEKLMQSTNEMGHSKDDASKSKNTNKGKRKKDDVASTSKNTTKRKTKTVLPFTLENLKPYFGKKINEVRGHFGASRSQFKRKIRQFGMERWPNTEKQARKLSQTLFEIESTQDNQHEISEPSSSSSLQVFQQNTNTQHPFVEEEGEKMMIKVRYNKHVIKFELRLSLGVVKLSEEVARRLNLSGGSFKLKYMDEDHDEILIACDEDLQLCPKVGPSKSIYLFVSE